MNIYEKLSLISTELSRVDKNLEVSYGQNKYKAVSETDVLKAIKPLEAKYKVYSYPFSRTIIESGTIESSKGSKLLFERIETVYRFINIEKPDEYIDITTYGDGLDSQDKSVGKAMTYADKYALLKAYKIVTGDDPDQNPSGETNKTEIKPTPISAELIDKCKELNIDMDKLAIYLKKTQASLTSEDLKKAIAQKTKALGGKK